MTVKIRTFAERFFEKFQNDDTTTLAASLAFYTALSLAPILILFVSISARLNPELQIKLVNQVREATGDEAAGVVVLIIDGAKSRPEFVSMASALGLLTLLLSASLIFGQLRTTLNRVFHIPVHSQPAASLWLMVWPFIKDRLVQMVLALGFIITMMGSLMVSTFILATVESGNAGIMMVTNAIASAALYLVLFTLLFRYLPDKRLPWLRAVQGGALTAALFAIGKELIGIYLGSSAIGSAYGAAGSIIVLLVWVYYSALITFIGAQVSFLLYHQRPSH